MTERKKVDWNKEIEKTERIRKKGILMSIISFAAACAFIFGVSRMSGEEIEIPRKILSVLCLFAAGFVFRAVLKHRANRDNKK